jgi:hypothetical protein
MSLKRPENKMSKSDTDPKSRILITDSAEDIHAKLRGAVTDSIQGISFDPAKRPGVSNLIEILKHVTESRDSSDYIAKDNANVSMRAFKEKIADEVIVALRGIRENFFDIMDSDNLRLREELTYGAMKARRKARMTMDTVKHALGIHKITMTDEDAADQKKRLRQMAEREAGAWLNVEANPFEGEEQDILDEDEDEDEEWDDASVKGQTLESLRRTTK